jgi:hypothetical protein
VNKANFSGHRGFGLALAAVAVASLLAATARGAQPAGNKQSSQDDATKRAVKRDNSASGGVANTPVTRRNIPSDNSSPTLRRVPSDATTKQLQSFQGTKGVGSSARTNGLRSSSVAVRSLADVDKDQKGKGKKGNKDSDTGESSSKRSPPPDLRKGPDLPVKRSTTDKKGPATLTDKNIGKKPPVEGVKRNTTLPPPVVNKSSIDDVRKRLDKKNVQLTPKDKMNIDAAKRLSMQKNVQKNVFQERLKAGDFNRLTAGETAKKLQLADQYRLYQKGDVARQLALEKNAGHAVLYHGKVSPGYQQHCMKYHYWGPAFFAGVCFYPHWAPWVDWSWHHHHHGYWDPRPIWCRPVIYEPCPIWVYWETPMWNPLPEAACGTWVDLKPVEIPPTESDLQLVAVRFVDPGHPEEKLGPRYRVWFRNNGGQAVAQPFNVVLFAGNDERLAEGMPQAGVRVTGVEPGAVQSVDIRLPAEVLAMGRDAQGNPKAFSALQVLVDANQEIAETTKANNGARLSPADVLPIDPAAFELKPTAAKPGEEILLAGEGFGPQPGRVLVQVGGRELDGEIVGWYDLGVQWSLPKLAVTGPVEANVVVIRGDGAAANPMKITIRP